MHLKRNGFQRQTTHSVKNKKLILKYCNNKNIKKIIIIISRLVTTYKNIHCLNVTITKFSNTVKSKNYILLVKSWYKYHYIKTDKNTKITNININNKNTSM